MTEERAVDVISVISADGKIRPLRLRMEEDGQMLRMDIEEVLSVKEIPYVGIESQIFLCRGRTEGYARTVQLRYSFRGHCWHTMSDTRFDKRRN